MPQHAAVEPGQARRSRGGPRHSAGSRSPRRITSTLLLTVAMFTLLAPSAESTNGPQQQNPCQRGAFCAWAENDYRGPDHRADEDHAALERCLPLPAGLEASSFTNQTGRPVTVYQDPDCSTNADFQTYPDGAFAPRAPYVARAITIWTH